MEASVLAELLKSEWGNLPGQLEGDWDEFEAAYEKIVSSLPSEPSRDELEDTVDVVCELLRRYDYTAGLLRAWARAHEPGRDRLLSSVSDNVGDKEQVYLISNQFRNLATPSSEDKAATAEK